jgi:hypoxanthine phosphoribosyltransferase
MGIVRLSWDKYGDLVKTIVKRVQDDDFKPELIVGIARSGLPLLTTISNYFNLKEVGVIFVQKTVTDAPFADRHPTAVLHGIGLPYPVAHKNVLLVDDIIRSGQSLVRSLEVLNELGAASVKVVTLYKQKGVYDFDVYAPLEVRGDDWIVFPWDEL